MQPDGIDLVYLDMPVEETFFRMLRNREFDIAELSLSSYTVSLFKDPKPFIAIPVWPSRFFRHSSIYINTQAGIREPGDLVGKRIGNPEYQMTAPVWIRGILQDEYGVPVDSVTYVTGGEEEPGRDEKLKLDLPPNIKVEPIGPAQTLFANARGRRDRRAADGAHAVDVPIAPRIASGGCSRTIRMRRRTISGARSLPDHAHGRDSPRALRGASVDRMSLYKAFAAAQKVTYADLYETAALKTMLPWLTAHVEEARRELGEDFWPYGFHNNRHVLDTFLRYHHEQGLSKRRLEPEALFAPETMEQFKI